MAATAPSSTTATPLMAFGVAALGIAIFSGMDAVMKGLTLAIGVYNTLLWRTLAATLIAGIVYALGRPRRPSTAALRLHLERGIVATTMALLFFWGLARVPLAQGIALSFIAPLIALFLAAVLLKERIGRGTIIASLVAFAGVLTIFAGQARADLGHQAFLGALAILASAVCYAYNIILMRRQSQVAGAVEVAFFQSLIVAVILGFGAPILAVVPAVEHVPALVFAAPLTTTSLFLLSWAYARAEASYLAPVEYTAFIWATILGYLVFGEVVGALTVVGAVLIVVGCIAAARRRPLPIAEAAL